MREELTEIKMIKLLIAGDLSPRGDAERFSNAEDIKRITASVKSIAEEYDFAMVNVETIFSDESKPIIKSGPNLKSKSESLPFVKGFGFNIGACANNHMGDYGEKGLLDTVENLKKEGLLTVGAGINEAEAQKPLYVEKNGVKLAIINCAEHEFGIAKKDRPGMAGMDYYVTSHLIKEAKKKADKVVLFMHGGNEFNPLPRKGMIKMCHFFAESGADAIVAAHSHCPQGYEIYNDVPIYYGTGNFYMSKPENSGMWEKGYMVSLEIEKEQPVKTELIPYNQAYDGSGIEILRAEKKESFLKYIECISRLIHNEEIYEKMTLAWAKRYIKDMSYFMQKTEDAYDNELTLFARNTYTCESHSELMRTYYEAFCERKLDGLELYDEYITKLQNYETIEF